MIDELGAGDVVPANKTSITRDLESLDLENSDDLNKLMAKCEETMAGDTSNSKTRSASKDTWTNNNNKGSGLGKPNVRATPDKQLDDSWNSLQL
jgi:hypothetical protein